MIKKTAMIMNLRWLFVVGGLISIIFSVAVYTQLPADEHDLIMLMGMFTGLGAAFVTIGAYGFILNARMTPEQKQQAKNELKDERNVMIRGKAFQVSGIVTTAFFTVSAFALVGLGHRSMAYMCIGGMYLQIISLALAQMYYQKKI